MKLKPKIDKIQVTENIYGKLDEEKEVLYLRAGSKEGYIALSKHASYKSHIIKNNFDTNYIKSIVIEELIAPVSGYLMFDGCNKLEKIYNIENLHTENMTNMMGMFQNCKSLQEINLDRFDTSNVTIMDYMFDGCRSLKELDLDGFDTSKVITIRFMFSSCLNITELDLTSFNTQKVNVINHLIYNCQNLSRINLSSFDTKEVKYMHQMFANCYNITEIDLDNFDTKKTENIMYMFADCKNLNKINFGELFIINENIKFDYMFRGGKKDIKIRAKRETIDAIKQKYTNFTDNNFEEI